MSDSMTNPDYLLKAVQIKKSYRNGDSEMPVLRGVDFIIRPGEAVSIQGASGAGKSTLLHIIGSLDSADSGDLFFQNIDLNLKNDQALSEFRNSKLGFVFQFHHLLPEFTAMENILMPIMIQRKVTPEDTAWALSLMQILEVGHRTDHLPHQMSGGEMQRIAIARALICRPALLLADEPTGNLDSDNAARVQRLFFKLQKEMNLSMVVVTHDASFASQFPQQLKMRDGLWV